MEERAIKFEEKLKNLVALGKKKKSILEIQEINEVFSDMELEAEQMEKYSSIWNRRILMYSESVRTRMMQMMWRFC